MDREEFIKIMNNLKIEKYLFENATNGTSELKCYECDKNYIKSQSGLTRIEIEGVKMDVIRCNENINHLKSISNYMKDFLIDYRIHFNGMKDLINCNETRIINYGCKIPKK